MVVGIFTLYIQIDVIVGVSSADDVRQVTGVIANVTFISGTYHQGHILCIAALITIRIIYLDQFTVPIPSRRMRMTEDVEEEERRR